jgi:hypothetical protein
MKMELPDQEYNESAVTGDEAILILQRNNCLDYGFMVYLHLVLDEIKTKAQLEDVMERLEDAKTIFG